MKKLIVHAMDPDSWNICTGGWQGHTFGYADGVSSAAHCFDAPCNKIHKRVTCKACLNKMKEEFRLPAGFSTSQLIADSYGRSQRKGWYTGVEFNIPEKLALIHSEVSEALEDHRNNRMVSSVNEKGKPEGFPTELADIIIRVADLAGKLGIDLDAEIRRKAEFNETREYRHGQKIC